MVEVRCVAENFHGMDFTPTVVYEISVKIRQAEKFASHLTKNLRRDYDFNFTTTIVVIMGRRLLDEVVYRIRLYIKANESVAAITEAVKVSKKTIYKLRLNLDIWGEPYALPTVTLGRHRSLLPYQEIVIYNIMVLRARLLTFFHLFALTCATPPGGSN